MRVVIKINVEVKKGRGRPKKKWIVRMNSLECRVKK